MADRTANVFVLVEDREHQNLIRRYLIRSGHSDRQFRFAPLPAKSSGGSGEIFVRDKYPEQVKACRSTIGKRASAILIVMIDADSETAQRRKSQLEDALQLAGEDSRDSNEPIVVLIPKRHVETWIRALLGEQVDESTDYSKAPFSRPNSNDIQSAAHALFGWTRPGAQPARNAPPSLITSIPEWQRIP